MLPQNIYLILAELSKEQSKLDTFNKSINKYPPKANKVIKKKK